ncbi:MAG: SulP family inorganic anion transporter, partial [Planctomycetota bacterium]
MSESQTRPFQSVGRDLIGGVVVFLVAIPLCLGIALASGAPLMSGLVTGIVGGIVVGLISGSHVSVSGPAAGLAAIVLAQIEGLGGFQPFLLAVVLAGVLQVAFGALRGGALANFFPNSVIRGLLAAIGVLLILKQLPHLVGHDTDPVGDMAFEQPDGDTTFTAIETALESVLPGAALVGLICFALLLIWPKTPLAKSLFPAPLAAVLLGVAINEILAASGSALAITSTHLVGVPVVGVDGATWSDVLVMPEFARIADPAIWLAAITIAIVASLETLLNLDATDRLDPQKRHSPPNRELVAQGVGNTLSGMIGGLPMTSVIVRSSVNAQSGATTRLSAITHGVLLLGSVALLPELLNRIPLSSLAAILIVTGFKLASPQVFRALWQQGISQFVPFVITILAIVASLETLLNLDATDRLDPQKRHSP